MSGGQRHGEEFRKLIERRRKFIEGLEANRGEINLDIFEDFYPDRAHFVYELLQNAEDAGATEVAFSLLPDKLVCEHDGRAFTVEDVRSITGIHDSTKAAENDKIGKFGVGFKSVFVYTAAPSVRSGEFAFRIVEKILPELISSDTSLGTRTRFEFPFDNPKKPTAEAHVDIAAGLKELDEKTLLFLTSLASVRWQIGADTTGIVRRLKHSDFHFEVLKEISGATTASSHFLKFDEAVRGLDKQRVAVAYPLDLLPGVSKFAVGKPLVEQLKIIPAEPGSVAVFFPAVKEASGLRFHLHAPFVPELSRASIKDTKANVPLFEQLGTLAAQSLHHIKALGLLTTEFLAVLPNPQDQIAPRYQGIRTAIVEEMKAQPLTPTHARGHAPAARLLQARASLKSLLSESDIEYLVDYEDEAPLWAVGATQQNSRIDHFLSGLGIREWGLDAFIDTLCDKVNEESFIHDIDEQAIAWLQGKPVGWLQRFYALLHAEASHEASRLKSLRIVRLADGSLSAGSKAFFASESTGSDVAVVDKAVYATGSSKKEQEGAKALLLLVGVREIGEVEEVELILKSRYMEEAERPDDATHIADLKRFVALTEKQPEAAEMFKGYYVFQAGDENEQWCRPEEIYLDLPYLDTGLSAYYGALAPDAPLDALHGRYRSCGLETERIGKFARAVGARTTLKPVEDVCSNNPEWNYLRLAGGDRASSYINRDYYIPSLAKLMVEPSIALARLVWRTLQTLPAYPDYLRATYRINMTYGARTAASRLVHELRAASWVPQGDGQFVRPADASRELLPKGFAFDPGYSWLKAIEFGATAVRASAQALQKEAAAQSLGFADAAAAERARRFNELPEAEQEQILAALDNRNKAAVPDRPLANPTGRAKNVRAQALKALDKESEVRERSVSIGREEVKQQADIFLREHYRNSDGEVTCQICKGPLPFKLEDGREYFETVEFLPELRKRHPQNYLSLCPNHSAMYRLVNGSRDVMREEFLALEGNELSVILADRDMTIYFSKTHVIDLRAVLEAEDSLPSEMDGREDESKSDGGAEGDTA